MTRSLTAVAAALCLAVVALLAAAGPLAAAEAPFAIQAASLRQDGDQLVWRVTLEHSFSPADLSRDHRALCLAIEPATSGTMTGEACVEGPAPHSSEARLEYRPLGSRGLEPVRVIDADVSRGSTAELTAAFPPRDISVPYRPLRWQTVSELSATGCPAGGCVASYPAQPALLDLHPVTLVGCTATGPPFVTSGPRAQREAALTFDDGPWPDTPQFLSVLEREHVPATFFEIGRQIPMYGEHGAIERRMLADGDMIGDHTWSHPDVAGAGPFAAAQIRQAAAQIRRATHGFEPCLFRAPYGDVSPALIAEARRLGFTTIQWDVDPQDWALPGTNAIYQNVVSHAHAGAIIIQHDGGGNRSETLAALPREIDTLRREGYRFVTVTDLLGERLVYK